MVGLSEESDIDEMDESPAGSPVTITTLTTKSNSGPVRPVVTRLPLGSFRPLGTGREYKYVIFMITFFCI